MTQIHLLTPHVVPGDAVTNDALGMMRWFRRRGYPATLYARRAHPALRRQVRPLREYLAHLDQVGDVLVYHHSVGWPTGIEVYQRSRNRKIVKYHNVTPAIFYRDYNRRFVKACVYGRRETRRLVRAGADVWLADSDFNGQELRRLGIRTACYTVAPIHRIGALDKLPLDRHLSAELRKQPTLLFVGRLAPNKGHLHVIRALAHYRHRLGGTARLALVGYLDPSLVPYRQELEAEAARLRVTESVHYAGKVSPRQLKTYYTHAAAFVCASEHEGFCVPLAEAMYYGLPIVAYGGTAVSHTLGQTGLAWETPAPALLAESICFLEENSEARAEVVRAQRERFDSTFTRSVIERDLEAALSPVLCGAARHV
jgi:glycosyltransferase involved in cell wall biosynthesis